MITITNEMYDAAYEARSENRNCGTCKHRNVFRVCVLHGVYEVPERATCSGWEPQDKKEPHNGLQQTTKCF